MADFKHGINTQEIVAKQALGLLESEFILGAFVGKSAGADFAGATDDTVMVRRPSKLAARTLDWRAGEVGANASKSREIVTDVLNETKMPVVLNRHIYSAIDLTDEQLTLDIDDFGAQVTAPQARAIAEQIEAALLAEMVGQSDDTHGIAAPTIGGTDAQKDEQAIRKAVLAARTKMNKDGVPTAGRILLIGADIEAALLQSATLTAADMSGTTAGLRQAIIGDYFGFRVVVSQLINPKTMVVLHPSAFIFVSRAPMTPPSVKAGASVAANGAAVRSIRDYNSTTLSDRQVLSTFAGFSPVKEPVFKDAQGKEYDPVNPKPIVSVEKNKVMRRSLVIAPKTSGSAST
ncbi:P22 phage major capsid protein family protein [Streptomyces sp. NPDC002120]|uniref:P22 phage major capsid protein family protein n=1 Tax=Streptomyces sp. NPDC002120 TaxID=3364631 RepID=UPI0036B200A3